MNEYKPIVLSSKKYEVTSIPKTKAMFFKDISVGDIIQFETNLAGSGRASHGCYAKGVVVRNLSTGEKVDSTMNDIHNRLRGFVIVEVQNG